MNLYKSLKQQLKRKGYYRESYYRESEDITYIRFSNLDNSTIECYPVGNDTYLTVINGLEVGTLTVEEIIHHECIVNK